MPCTDLKGFTLPYFQEVLTEWVTTLTQMLSIEIALQMKGIKHWKQLEWQSERGQFAHVL